MNHLIVAGLIHKSAGVNNDTLNQHPILQDFFDKAERKSHPYMSSEAVLCQQFSVFERNDLPTASICHFAEFKKSEQIYWLHFDPVHLKADRDKLILFDGQYLSIQREEAHELLEFCQTYFEDEQWVLVQKTPYRWYLGLKSSPQITTSLLSDVTGKSINPYLLKGKEEKKWQRILSEIQMLFFQAPINLQRERQNKITINGVWISGGGFCPQVSTTIKQAWESNPSLLLKGLTQLAEIPLKHVDIIEKPKEPTLYYYNDIEKAILSGNKKAWFKEVALFAEWFETYQNKVKEFYLYPINGYHYQVIPSFWKKFF
jgi:hypothetical protein